MTTGRSQCEDKRSGYWRVGQQPSKSMPGPAVDGGGILAEWVEARKFSATRLRPGYDEEEVDAFLTEAELRKADPGPA
jgi:DivIVA domain-containing protein